MTSWNPIKRREFVRRLRRLGLEGPYSGTRHEFMVFEGRRLAVPSNGEYSVPQLRMMLRELELVLGRDVPVEEWEGL